MSFDIKAAGMVTPVGYDWAASCAAMRVAIDGFRDTRFMFDGAWLRGASVELPDNVRGRALLLDMAVSAARECLRADPQEAFGLAVCVAERERAGRLGGLDEPFGAEIARRLAHSGPLAMFHAGTTGAVRALEWGRGLLASQQVRRCLVVGVDSFHHAVTLAAYHARRELVTARNADGFLPGEAAGAVLMTAPASKTGCLRCLGIGWGTEPSDRDSSLPLRADGLVAAVRSALTSSRCGYEEVDYRITDMTGGQRAFKEAALALTRTMRARREFFDIWHPADCIGRVGAASLPIMLGVALAAARRRYAPGPGVLCQVGDEDGTRAALVLRALDGARSAS